MSTVVIADQVRIPSWVNDLESFRRWSRTEDYPQRGWVSYSAYSARKDTKILRNLYWRAGIPEYWLVDARKKTLRFEIVRWTERGYSATRRRQGWLKSKAFGRSFLLETKLGHPRFFLRSAGAGPSSKA